jgi:hypothetical protein
MTQYARWVDHNEREIPAVQPSRRLSFLRFFLRYPIFLLAFGPPILKPPTSGVDTSKAHFDFWNIVQVGWLFVVAVRAIFRLVGPRSILIPWQVRSILKYAFFLGILFIMSVVYSPGRTISAEYSILYFLNLICVMEFLVDAYRNPPNWMQCVMYLRVISLMLFALVLLILPFKPALVMMVQPGAGIRLICGAVATVPLICPLTAIISAYCFLHSLESRFRSVVLFLIGFIGLMITQTRGGEIAMFAILGLLAFGWARTSKRSASIFIAGFMATILLAGVFIGTVGGERIWNIFNRGQDIGGIVTATGRTKVWADVIQYSVTHPEGMGYIAGIRASRIATNSDTSMHVSLNNVGGTDNAYMQVLADAGWLALTLYLTMLVKVLVLGWRTAKTSSTVARAPITTTAHALRCSLLLLAFCLLEQMEGSNFVIPLREEFYIQNIIIVIILGASASVIIAFRSRETSFRV